MHVSRITILFVVNLCLTVNYLQAQSRNPTGERAVFIVDQDRARTSAMVRGGNFNTYVIGPNEVESEPGFDVKLDYSFQTIFEAVQGSEQVFVAQTYFDEQFLADLRESHHYVASDFKIEHLGFRNARTMFGQTFANCDYLRFYEIKTGQNSPYLNWFYKLLAVASGSAVNVNEVENLEIFVHIAPGIPVLGGVKLDAKGLYQGMQVKVGADYKP